MPSKPLRRCITPGCPARVRAGRCKQHGGEAYAKAKGRFDYGAPWRKLRARKLLADPNCERCGAPAWTVDHIRARSFGGSDDWGNLMSLCKRCALTKNGRDGGEGRRRKAAR